MHKGKIVKRFPKDTPAVIKRGYQDYLKGPLGMVGEGVSPAGLASADRSPAGFGYFFFFFFSISA
jgi:hypothetical protein